MERETGLEPACPAWEDGLLRTPNAHFWIADEKSHKAGNWFLVRRAVLAKNRRGARSRLLNVLISGEEARCLLAAVGRSRVDRRLTIRSYPPDG
jgi:hypothetical protein